jgi:hypothetical protein
VTDVTYHPPGLWLRYTSKIGSEVDAPPGGPYVHTMGGKVVEQPREIASPSPG